MKHLLNQRSSILWILSFVVVLCQSCSQPSDKASDSASTGPAPAAPVQLKILMAAVGKDESSNPISNIYAFSFNPKSNVTLAEGSPLLIPNMLGSDVRSFSFLSNGSLVAGSGNAPAGSLFSPILNVLSGFSLTGGKLSNFHTICPLPNGHIIVAEYSGGQYANEYDMTGNFLRPVFRAVTVGVVPTLTSCQALSASEFLGLESDGNHPSRGILRHFVLTSGAWAPTNDVFDSDVFNQNQKLNFEMWSFAMTPDGNVYFGSFLREAKDALGAATQFGKCAANNLDSNSCSVVPGDMTPGDNSAMLYDMTSIPGTNDFIYATQTSLYRYFTATGTMLKIFDSTKLPNYVLARRILVH